MTPAEPWQWALVVFSFGLCYLFVGLGRGWLMRAIQLTIILAVMGSNVQWHWTPSPVVPGLFGIAAAWLVTVPPLSCIFGGHFVGVGKAGAPLAWRAVPLARMRRSSIASSSPCVSSRLAL